MKLYAAPLEGLTGFAWRKAHHEIFGGIDKYFAPFISPNQNHILTERARRDLVQNEINLVPQILTKNSVDMLWAVDTLNGLGYTEMNLNLGCPSGTVVAKGKGAGALRNPGELDAFLDEVYSRLPDDVSLSIKTRIGIDDSSNWWELLEIFQKYPASELIVHPRVAKQFYNGTADRELFKETLATTTNSATEGTDCTRKLKFVYNGDVSAPGDEAFGYGCDVMIGRGLISRPSLAREVQGGPPATGEELREFHRLVLDGYESYMPGELPTLHRMKEFWHYYESNFDVDPKLVKKILKAKRLPEYKSACEGVFRNANIL